MKFEVTIIDYDHKGRGMARINNKIAFIPNTMIDEIVNIKIIKEKKNYIEAEVIDFIKKEQKSICSFFCWCYAVFLPVFFIDFI